MGGQKKSLIEKKQNEPTTLQKRPERELKRKAHGECPHKFQKIGEIIDEGKGKDKEQNPPFYIYNR